MVPFRCSGIPIEAQYRCRQGREYVKKGDDAAALVCFRQAVCIAPAFSAAYREYGDCLCRLGRSEEAAWYYRKAGNDPPPCGTIGSRAGIPGKNGVVGDRGRSPT